MNTSRSYTLAYGLIGLAIIALIGFFLWGGSSMNGQPSTSTTTSQTAGPIEFACTQGKTISATFTNNPAGTSTVLLSLSDGRSMTIPQTVSADGGRYANADETFVFWTKGNTAFVEEGNTHVPSPTLTYKGCIMLGPDSTGTLTQSYVDAQDGFSVRYPAGYTPSTSYKYQELGPGKDISGVKFTIPASMANSTNLADDTYVSVEEIPRAQSCSASLFLADAQAQQVTEGDTTYSAASSTGAAAGNRYEEWAYAIPGTNPCIAVRYFIHYGVIDNYPQGTVQQFDEASLLSQFDAIRKSLVIGQ